MAVNPSANPGRNEDRKLVIDASTEPSYTVENISHVRKFQLKLRPLEA